METKVITPSIVINSATTTKTITGDGVKSIAAETELPKKVCLLFMFRVINESFLKILLTSYEEWWTHVCPIDDLHFQDINLVKTK